MQAMSTPNPTNLAALRITYDALSPSDASPTPSPPKIAPHIDIASSPSSRVSSQNAASSFLPSRKCYRSKGIEKTFFSHALPSHASSKYPYTRAPFRNTHTHTCHAPLARAPSALSASASVPRTAHMKMIPPVFFSETAAVLLAPHAAAPTALHLESSAPSGTSCAEALPACQTPAPDWRGNGPVAVVES